MTDETRRRAEQLRDAVAAVRAAQDHDPETVDARVADLRDLVEEIRREERSR